MANLQKIIKVTQAQYDTLRAGGTVGEYTGLNENYIYFVKDELGCIPKILYTTELTVGELPLGYSELVSDTGYSIGLVNRERGSRTQLYCCHILCSSRVNHHYYYYSYASSNDALISDIMDPSNEHSIVTFDDLATQDDPGLMSAEDKTKLDGIEDGAEVNVVENIQTAAGAHINEIGTPSVTPSTSGKTTTLTFNYLKGQKGDTGATGPTGPTGPAGLTTQVEVNGETFTQSGGKITLKDYAERQATTTIVIDALTNLNYRVLSAYTATLVEDTYIYYVIKYGSQKCTEEQAKNYMEYMTGSRFLPVYNQQKPKNSIFMFADRTL